MAAQVALVEIVRQLTASEPMEMGHSGNPFINGGGAEMFFETSAALIFFAVLGRYAHRTPPFSACCH